MLKRKDYHYLYDITHRVTPLAEDCGTLCGRACCQPGRDSDLGIYLFPGEETMFTRRESWLTWEEQNPAEQLFPASWPDPVYFVRCTGTCPRDKRPLACRLFPLVPHLQKDGSMLLIYETMHLPYTCPLITRQIKLQQQFVSTVKKVWKLLLQDPCIRDLIVDDSRYREENNLPIQAVEG